VTTPPPPQYFASAADFRRWLETHHGVRRRIDDEHYSIRFTPRKAGSIWSAVNLQHVNALIAQTPHAFEFFARQPAGYRMQATWWVISAKQPTTRARRLAQLIACSGNRERLPQYSR
jgi:uncharacterized protein YdeI (YjbR/CyaY-like superfamily)